MSWLVYISNIPSAQKEIVRQGVQSKLPSEVAIKSLSDDELEVGKWNTYKAASESQSRILEYMKQENIALTVECRETEEAWNKRYSLNRTQRLESLACASYSSVAQYNPDDSETAL